MRKIFNITVTLFDNVDSIMSIACYMIILLVLTANTLLRYIFGSGVYGSEEIARCLIIWFVYIGASLAGKHNVHISIDAALKLYPIKWRKYIDLIGSFIWLLCMAYIAYYGFLYTYSVMQRGGYCITVPIPLWTVYAAIPLGHLLLSFRVIEIIINRIKAIKDGSADQNYGLC